MKQYENNINVFSVNGILRESLLNFSLENNNKEMFLNLTKKGWESYIFGNFNSINEDLDSLWEIQLLQETIGDIEFYYKDRPVYDELTQRIISEISNLNN